MTHYLNGFSPDVECEACNGHGEVCGVNPNRRSRFVGQDDLSPDDFTVECAACAGSGFRPMTQDIDQYRDKSGCQYCDGYCHGGCREGGY